MKPLNIALVLNTPSRGRIGNHAPISLLYLASPLVRAGHHPVVLDRRTFDTPRQFLAALVSCNPDLVGICLFCDGYTLAYELVNRLRRHLPSVRVVLGGPEVSAAREQVVEAFDNVDYFLSGEAETTLLDLANALADGDVDRVDHVRGLSFRRDGEVRHNPPPSPLRDVDSIPFPQRSLISADTWKKHYFFLGLDRPADVLLTSRGCPFSCGFCYRLSPGYRARSAQNVLDEMSEIYSAGRRGLSIVDDNFLTNRKRCTAILEGILQKGWQFTIKCRGRVDSVDPDRLKLMKRAGIRSVTYGMESGSQQMLDAMNKRVTVDQIRTAIRMTRQAGLLCYVDLFIGFPGETPDTIEMTSRFLAEARPSGIQLGILYPLHGTPVYDQARADGTLVGDWGLLQDFPWVRLPWARDISVLRQHARAMTRRFWCTPAVLVRAVTAALIHFRVRDYLCVLREIRHTIR